MTGPEAYTWHVVSGVTTLHDRVNGRDIVFVVPVSRDVPYGTPGAYRGRLKSGRGPGSGASAFVTVAGGQRPRAPPHRLSANAALDVSKELPPLPAPGTSKRRRARVNLGIAPVKRVPLLAAPRGSLQQRGYHYRNSPGFVVSARPKSRPTDTWGRLADVRAKPPVKKPLAIADMATGGRRALRRANHSFSAIERLKSLVAQMITDRRSEIDMHDLVFWNGVAMVGPAHDVWWRAFQGSATLQQLLEFYSGNLSPTAARSLKARVGSAIQAISDFNSRLSLVEKYGVGSHRSALLAAADEEYIETLRTREIAKMHAASAAARAALDAIDSSDSDDDGVGSRVASWSLRRSVGGAARALPRVRGSLD